MRILVAMDDSDCSRASLQNLTETIYPPGTEIKIVSVVDFLEPLPAIAGVKEKEIERARAIVENAAKEVSKCQPNADVSYEVIDGFVTDEVLNVCTKWKADLIMVGSHGRHGLSEFLMGSTSHAVLLHAHCSVRVVRSSQSKEDRGLHVMVCIDESKYSASIIDHILSTPWPVRTHFKCVHVMPELSEKIFLDPDCEFAYRMSNQYDDLYRIQKKLLDDAAGRLKDAYGKKAASSEVLFGEPRKALIKHAKDWPADLVILGSHGKRGVERLLLGSVSEAVATHAACSVEITRATSVAKNRLPHLVF